MAPPAAQASSSEWLRFFDGVKECRLCRDVRSNFKLKDPVSKEWVTKSFKVVNPLLDLSASDDWGMPWYDRHRNFDAEVMVVGMDFGGEGTVRRLAELLSADPNAEIGEEVDKTFAKLVELLFERTGDPLEQITPGDVYVTNAALCIREYGCPETGELSGKIYTNCQSHLRTQINLIKPYVIVALGNVALDSVCRALGKTPKELGLLCQVTKDASVETTVQIGQANIAIKAFLHPGREQPKLEWDYQRHRTDLYGPLRRLLKTYRQQVEKSAFREQFGELAPITARRV